MAEAVLRALQAGADVALWVQHRRVPAVLDRLGAVNSGELSAQRVGDAVTKLVGMKGTNPIAEHRRSFVFVMAGGTKRLRAVRRAADASTPPFEVFSINGYHETSMDAIAAAPRSQADAVPVLRIQGGSVRGVSGP